MGQDKKKVGLKILRMSSLLGVYSGEKQVALVHVEMGKYGQVTKRGDFEVYLSDYVPGPGGGGYALAWVRLIGGSDLDKVYLIDPPKEYMGNTGQGWGYRFELRYAQDEPKFR